MAKKKIRHVKRPDPIRLLAQGRGDGHGYTDIQKYALDDEPEAVDAAFQEELSDGGWRESQLRRAQESEDELNALLARLSSDLTRLRELGRRSGVDVSSDLRVVQRRYDAARAKIAHAHKAA